jgi:hypothetical protein
MSGIFSGIMKYRRSYGMLPALPKIKDLDWYGCHGTAEGFLICGMDVAR